MDAVNNSFPIHRSAELLVNLTDELKRLRRNPETDPHSPHIKYLGLLLVHTIRQVQAICILIDNPAPVYAEQAGQLLRGLCEIYAKAAWMMHPETESERDYRALCLEKSSIVKEHLSEDQQREVIVLVGIDKYEEEVSELSKPPSTKDMLSEIGASDVYDFFRWESSAVHMSLTTLATTVHGFDTKTGHVMLGGPNHPVHRAMRLWLALDILRRIADVVITGSCRKSHDWENIRSTITAEIVGLLSPLAVAEVTT